MVKPFKIRDKIYEVMLYDNGYVFKRIPVIANTEEDAIEYFRQIPDVPEHSHYAIRLVSGDNTS